MIHKDSDIQRQEISRGADAPAIPAPYVERKRNPINRWINARIDRVTEDALQNYIQTYAVAEDGTLNEPLAKRIEYEIGRRSEMGREIDVMEPARWTSYSAMIGVASGTAAKIIGEKLVDSEKVISASGLKNTLTTTAVAAFAAAAVMGGRILSLARFKSGLYAGAQTALALEAKQQASVQSNDPSPLLELPDAKPLDQKDTPDLKLQSGTGTTEKLAHDTQEQTRIH